jgi:ACT domain-containing protein
MRILLSLLLELFVLTSCCGCSVSQLARSQIKIDAVQGYEIIIRFNDYGNAMSQVMDVFSRNGLKIMKVQQAYLSSGRQEIRISIRNGNSRQLNEAEDQLRSVMNVESLQIERN